VPTACTHCAGKDGTHNRADFESASWWRISVAFPALPLIHSSCRGCLAHLWRVFSPAHKCCATPFAVEIDDPHLDHEIKIACGRSRRTPDDALIICVRHLPVYFSDNGSACARVGRLSMFMWVLKIPPVGVGAHQ